MRRQKLVTEIYKHAELLNSNQATVVFILAMMTDRQLTKFHKEFLSKKPNKII